MYIEDLYHKILNRVAREPTVERVVKSTVEKKQPVWYVKDLEVPGRRTPPKGFKTKKEAVAYAERNADAVLDRLKQMIEIRQSLPTTAAAVIDKIDKNHAEMDRLKNQPSDKRDNQKIEEVRLRALEILAELGRTVLPNLVPSEHLTAGRMYMEKIKQSLSDSQWQAYVETLQRKGKLIPPKPQRKSKPLPADAEKPTDLMLNSHAVTCYGKNLGPGRGRGYRVYCRKKG